MRCCSENPRQVLRAHHTPTLCLSFLAAKQGQRSCPLHRTALIITRVSVVGTDGRILRWPPWPNPYNIPLDVGTLTLQIRWMCPGLGDIK